MRKINALLFIPYILWMILFIIVPVILLFYFSLIDIKGHFGLENYKLMISLKYFIMICESVCFAIAITCITLLISYPAAYFINSSKHKNVWLLILIVPTWINLLLKTYAFIGIFSHDGIINQILNFLHLPKTELLFTVPAFLIVASYIYIPFMILPIFNSMKDIPNNILQASSDLGASPLTTFRKIIVPLTKQGVLTGIQITFIPALSLFMITRLISGNKVINIGTAIEEQFLVIQNYGMGSTIALFLIFFMALILIITNTKATNGKR
ncbi:ABC transporter permease [Staphylococcus sp. NAM3COL9]|uniref:ABC transporter permease n=1 Tax=Staphylococcus sp. NAM3COL9 TaxID=1667172 RepID=UPI00070EC284|nr:ABC transporter permease [Staphylococcus sp. NAM3COL9]KRG10638.1 spermidine/putrescine ABC transporter permease [Staphylococcus sp. NAM3COL9]